MALSIEPAKAYVWFLYLSDWSLQARLSLNQGQKASCSGQSAPKLTIPWAYRTCGGPEPKTTNHLPFVLALAVLVVRGNTPSVLDFILTTAGPVVAKPSSDEKTPIKASDCSGQWYQGQNRRNNQTLVPSVFQQERKRHQECRLSSSHFGFACAACSHAADKNRPPAYSLTLCTASNPYMPRPNMPQSGLWQQGQYLCLRQIYKASYQRCIYGSIQGPLYTWDMAAHFRDKSPHLMAHRGSWNRRDNLVGFDRQPYHLSQIRMYQHGCRFGSSSFLI